MILLVGVGLIIGLVGLFFNPFIGMVTLMGINIIQPGELYPIYNAVHVERVVAILTLVMVLMKGPKFAFPKLTQWTLYFFAGCVASIPFAFWVSNSVTSAMDFGKTIILSVLLTCLTTTRKRLKVVLITFSILVAYLAVTSLIAYFQGNFQFRMDVDRAVGLTSASDNPDTLGLTIATALPVMFLFLLKGSKASLRFLTAGLIAVVVLAMLLTGSRGALLTLVIVLALGVMLSRRRLLVLPVVIGLSFAIWAALPQQYKDRYSSVNHLQDDASYQNRIISWEGGWQMFLTNPLTGMGIGNYTFANGAKFWPGPGPRHWLDAHSLYFKILGELGLVGVVTFFGFVVVFFKTNRELTRQMKERPDIPNWMRYYPRACNLALVGLLYCGYAYHDLYRSTWYFLAAVSAAFLLILQREARDLTGALPAVEDDGYQEATQAGAPDWPVTA